MSNSHYYESDLLDESSPLLGENKPSKSDHYWRDIIGLAGITVLFGIGNNIAFAQMADKMNSITYAPWLLYATAIPYTFLYLGIVLYMTPSWELQRFDLWGPYVLLGLMIGFSGILSQFADPFIQVDLQGVLTVLVLPATYIGVRLFVKPLAKLPEVVADDMMSVNSFKTTTRTRKVIVLLNSHASIIGCVLIMIGVIVAPLQSMLSTSDGSLGSPLGIIAFSVSQILQAGVDVVQQRIFHREKASVYPQLLYSNLVTIPLYLLSPLITLIPSLGNRTPHQMLSDQVDANECFVGHQPLPENCEGGAWPWVVAFVICYVMYFVFTAILVNKYDAVMQAVVISIVSPFTSIVAIVPLFGDEVPSNILYVSLAIMMVGCLVYIYGDKVTKGARHQLAK